MTEIYGLFDAADPMDPDRVYTSEAFARLFRTMMRDGIVHNDGDELAVGPTVPAAMSVSVGTGMALIQGRYYINSAALTLSVEAADPSHPRIDRVVVRLSATPGRTIHAVVKKGTPAPSPVPPGLTRTAETWELSLAQVRVEAGATSIVAAKITDERGNVSLCGVAAPVYVPSSQLEVVGAVNMQGKALTGLPVPNAATDAARRNMGGATLQGLGTPSATTDAATKAYVDAAVAEKIGGFGISQIAIDADKNWNGKSITNVGAIDVLTGNIGARTGFVDVPGATVTRKTVSMSTTLNDRVWTNLLTVTVPTNYSATEASNARFIVNISGAPVSIYPTLAGRVMRGGVEIGIKTVSTQTPPIRSVAVDTTGGFRAGDVLVIAAKWDSTKGEYPSVTATSVSITSDRSTEIPAKKVFAETVW